MIWILNRVRRPHLSSIPRQMTPVGHLIRCNLTFFIPYNYFFEACLLSFLRKLLKLFRIQNYRFMLLPANYHHIHHTGPDHLQHHLWTHISLSLKYLEHQVFTESHFIHDYSTPSYSFNFQRWWSQLQIGYWDHARHPYPAIWPLHRLLTGAKLTTAVGYYCLTARRFL